jgi:hypothetical protein
VLPRALPAAIASATAPTTETVGATWRSESIRCRR